MIPDNLTPAQQEAIEELLHNLDLIHALPPLPPLPSEIAWALERAC